MTTMNLSETNDDGTTIRCGDGNTALIVDDHPEIFLMITLWLKDLGYRVLTAADGREAQGIFQEQGIASIDLLITDLNMPRMGGGELIRWLLQENPRARVLVISDSPNEARLPEEVVFLQKPFRSESFIARLGELLSVPA
jgi:CheY-like chemotaxis protein